MLSYPGGALRGWCNWQHDGFWPRYWGFESSPPSPAARKRAAREPGLLAIMRGQESSTDAGELREAAAFSYARKRPARAAELYRAAFEFVPALEEKYGYDAARATVLAGCGGGEDSATLSSVDRARMRKQGLALLRRELRRAAARPDRGSLPSWRHAPPLAGVRGQDALAQLPPDEAADWESLWVEVRALLAGR